ncbi:MAG TPA: LacI family DNA-binding transcriptional regulator [Spirochaetia bacterium]|nr:LacI family DNA-binding transcriptional regulator [Spirochaetia bacterium]
MKPTILQVAQQANVSVATVSRIVNGLEGYSEETRVRVQQAIDTLGYQPNAIARGLVNRKTRTIGVLLPSVTNHFATPLLQGLEDAAHEAGYSVIVCNTESNGRRTQEYLRVLGEKQIDGLVFTSEWVNDDYGRTLEAMKIPVVLVATSCDAYPFAHVKVDDRAASRDAVRFLLDKGHRRVGLVSGPAGDPIAGGPRIEGWKDALAAAGLPHDDRQIAYGDFHFPSGRTAMADLWARFPEMTAVFATSDEMAMGVLSFCHDRGIPVPGRLSVLGYDDTQIAEMGVPPLSSVHQPIYEMGRAAAGLLFQRDRPESRIFPHHIVDRASVGPADP